MLYIDNRVGSKELINVIDSLNTEDSTIRTVLTKLSFGDFAFLGTSDKDNVVPAFIGIERKTISDFVQSMISGRLQGHQLPGMKASYNYSYIILEGIFKLDSDGYLQILHGHLWKQLSFGKRKFTINEFISQLNTVLIVFEVPIIYTVSLKETAQYVKALYSWWDKGITKHSTLYRTYKPVVPFLKNPSLVFNIAKELPGIGFTRAGIIADHFKSAYDLITASNADWKRIKGIPLNVAERIFKVIRKES